MKGKMYLTIFIGFICLLQLSGCSKEKQEVPVKDFKQETSNMNVPVRAVFDSSKVVTKMFAGHIDVVEPQKATSSVNIHIGGWAADLEKKEPAKAVIVVIDGKQAFVPIQIGFTREDVAKAHKNDNLIKSGWDGGFSASIMGKGKHKLEFYALLDDGKFVPLKYREKIFAEIEVIE